MLACRTFLRSRNIHLCVTRLAPTRYFTKKHEWVSVNGEVGIVGITDFAADQLGDVVFVDLPSVGTAVDQGDSAGAVESVKAASDIYSPVSGEVVERNEKLESEPGLLNKSPFQDGWLYKLKVKDASELKTLLTSDAYEQHKKEEEAAH